GVGALAAAVAGYYRGLFGDSRPVMTVVEPDRAACLYESARQGTGQARSVGGDLVRVTANGKGDIERISIDPSLLKPEEKEALEELCSAAVNQAVARARELAQAEMARLMGGLDLPPGLLDPSLLNGRP
ncbi:MAG TPA: YbaB/EbfC family nucleoid-associated protein, partial [Candidatus Latescibacteria bacterium]|nr:YbaB/EbfC family nucleoid-associated protein [Candidatus Latescibacterota bacterium]